MLAAASADRLGELSEFGALVFVDSFPSRLSGPFYTVLRYSREDGESAICFRTSQLARRGRAAVPCPRLAGSRSATNGAI